MESIHPNDIMTLDLDSISYVTLKNGNMILIDDSVPQKSNTEKNNNQIKSSINQNESNIPKKDIKLEISSPLNISFEGNIDPNKYKSNFNICSEIINNTNFSFNAVKNNKINFKNDENDNNFDNKDKEDKRMKEIINNDNNNNNNKDNENYYSNRPSLKETELKPMINLKNNINENDINISKTGKSEYNQSNLNTNLSIPNVNIQNNPINKSSTNINEGNRRRRSSLFGGTGRKNRISINAVCSLNIKAEEKYNINLIHQFNGIVDKLNAERDKKPIYDSSENEKENRNIKYYEFYKNKNQVKFMRNIDTLTQNYGMSTNTNFNYNKINETTNFNTYNNYIKKKSLDFNGINKKNELKNSLLRDSYGKSPISTSFNKIKNYRNKIYKYTTELVLPSNKFFIYKK